MGKPDQPPPPDYAAAAQAEGQANIDAAITGGKINNPNVVNPYGSQTVTWGQGTDQAAYENALKNYQSGLEKYYQAGGKQQQIDSTGVPMKDEQGNPIYQDLIKPIAPNLQDYVLGDKAVPTLVQKFSPEQQALYDQSVETKRLLGQLGEQGANSLFGVVGKQLDLSGLPSSPGSAEATRNKVVDAMMARVNEDTAIARDIANSDLIAAGIRPGSKAYDDKMNLINRQYNDARNQAMLAGGQEASRDFGMDTQRRAQGLSELLATRQVPLNEITALLSGSQVSNPFAVPGYAQNANVQAAPVFAAQNALSDYNTDVYNAKAAQKGQMVQGLFGLAGAGVQGAGAAKGFGNLFTW